MKNKFLLSALAGTVLLTSCLKDKNITEGMYGPGDVEKIKIVEIHDGPAKTFSYNASATAQDYEIFEVRLNAPASSDVNVTLQSDAALVANYNTKNKTNYQVIPESIYTLKGLNVTIPKGSLSTKVVINLKADDLTSGPYALGLKIAGSSDPSFTVSGNYGSIVAVLGARNKFDGRYKLTLSSTGWGAFDLYDGPEEFELGHYDMITASGTTVTGFFEELHSALQPGITSGGGATQFGATTPVFVFDPATNKLVEVYNSTPDDGRGRKLKINPAVTDSGFDPDTKTIKAAYIMSQTGRPDQYFYMKLTHESSRP